MTTILGNVRDIQPNGPRPVLELYFAADDRGLLPAQHKDAITLLIEGQRWTGTIGLKDGNPPYVHTNLQQGATKSSCTDVFLALGLAEKAVLRFRANQRGVLELEAIQDKGRWRPGGDPSERPATRPAVGRGAAVASNVSPAPSNAASSPSPVPSSFPASDRKEILRLADRYWSLITAGERAEEKAFEVELPAWRQRRELPKELFVRIARWKSVRKTPNYLENSDADVLAATRQGFAAAADIAAVAALTRLSGVAVRTASALLQWMAPERYPILDFRVLRALGEPEPSNYDDPHFYARFAERVRALASRLAIDLRTLDRAMWAWDKLHGAG